MTENNLQYHLEKYSNNMRLQNFLKKLLVFLKDLLDVRISYTQSYVRIDFPSRKKWAWIDTLESGNALRFRFHDINYDGEEQFPELQSFSNEVMELKCKKGDGFSTVLIKDDFDLNNPRFIEFLNRKYYEYKAFYEDNIDVKNIKQNFYDTIGTEKSIQNYQKAYIILLLRSFFEFADKKGQANLDEIGNYYREFYLDRDSKGYQTESSPINSVMNNLESSNINHFKQLIKDNPLKTKTLQDFVSLDDNKVKINKALWYQLTRDDIYQISSVLNKQLAYYFNERVDGDCMAIPDVINERIVEALKEFDQKLGDNEQWRNFTDKKNHKYAIQYNNSLYPVKQIISMATGAHVSTFSGGREANSYLKKKGFNIIELDSRKSRGDFTSQLKEKFDMVMDNYYEARLHQEFAGNELGNLFRNELPQIIENYLVDFEDINEEEYEARGSIGQGNWAKVPWLAVLDKNITTSIQEGVYVVYLFSEDMTSLYLTLNQGVTNTTKEELIATRDKLRKEMELILKTDDNINLSKNGLGSN